MGCSAYRPIEPDLSIVFAQLFVLDLDAERPPLFKDQIYAIMAVWDANQPYMSYDGHGGSREPIL